MYNRVTVNNAREEWNGDFFFTTQQKISETYICLTALSLSLVSFYRRGKNRSSPSLSLVKISDRIRQTRDKCEGRAAGERKKKTKEKRHASDVVQTGFSSAPAQYARRFSYQNKIQRI